MTLSVHRCTYIGHSLDPIDWDYAETLAGVEVTRWELWGCEALIALGAQMLPDLRASNVYCPPDQLDDLEADVRLVLDHLDELAAASGYRPDYIAFRANNILAAVLWAKENAGGVVIW